MSVWSRIFGIRQAAAIYVWPHAPTGAPHPSQLPAVVRATQLISTDVARLPLRVETEDGTPVDSPVASLLTREANRWQSGFDFRRYVTSCALSSGNGLALIRRANDGTVAELQPIPDGAASCELVEDGVEYQIGGVKLTSDQVLHIGCYPDRLHPCWFVSPLDAALPAMNLAADQENSQANAVRTGSLGKVAISHPGALSDQAVQAIRDAWQTMHATSDGASRPLILREGMKAEKIGQETWISALENRKYSVQEIARAFGVPPEMLFQQGGGALASQSETARAYVDGGLSQWVNAWESELTRKLCNPGERVRLDVDVLLRGNLRDAGMAFSKLVLAGVMSPNDARKRLGLEQLEGLDEPKVSMPGGASAGVGPDNPDAEGDANA